MNETPVDVDVDEHDDDQLPEVSTIIATRNRPEMLRSCINAVLQQTYTGRIEIIVVFDQSEPEPELEMIADRRRVRVIRNSRTPGLAGARNSGIDTATGAYIAFCDDDDEWLPEKLRAQVEKAEETGLATVVTGITIVYQKKRFPRIPDPVDMRPEALATKRVMEAHMSTVLVRRDALLASIGRINEELPGSYGEDFEWILRAARHGPIAVVQVPLVDVRWGGSQFSKNWNNIVTAIDFILEHDQELKKSPPGYARLLGRRSFALAAMGESRDARSSAFETLRLNWRERRAYLAFAVSLRVVSADRLMHWAHSRGHGI